MIRFLIPPKTCRAMLDLTAEGGCLHVAPGRSPLERGLGKDQRATANFSELARRESIQISISMAVGPTMNSA
jgi:hypothetical protein